MKKTLQKGIAQLVILSIMGLLAVVLPIATKLVQQNQENRSQAASTGGVCTEINSKECCSGNECTCTYDSNIGKYWKKTEDCGDPGCSNGECKSTLTKKCTPNTGRKCDGGKLSRCNSDGSDWKTPTNCVTGACKNTTACSTVQTVGEKCASSYKQCVNSIAWSCNSSNKIVKKVCDYGCSGTTCSTIKPAVPLCSSKGGSCVEDTATCEFYNNGKVVSGSTTCDSLSKVCCKISTANFCKDQGGTCVAKGTCTGTVLTARGCTSTKPVCCKSNINYGYKCTNNVLKKCQLRADGTVGDIGCTTEKTCTNDTICSADLQKCVDKTMCKDGNVGVLVGDKRCIDNKLKTCLSSGKFNAGTACGVNQECNSAGTKCVVATCSSSIVGQTKCLNGNVKECKKLNTTGMEGMGVTGDVYEWELKTTCTNGCVQKTSTKAECKSGGGGNGDGDNNNPSDKITGITLTPNPLNLKVGQSGKITVKTVPAGKTATYTWSSSNANVASVDVTGKVTGKKVGVVNIKATVKGTTISKAIKVNVTAAATPTGSDPSSDVGISFKVAFAGITVGSSECVNEYFIPETRLKLEVNNVPTNKFDDTIESSFIATDEIDSKGNQIFKVTQELKKDIFGSVDKFNYVKVKGPWHLKRKFCQDGQSNKLADTTVCDIDLKVKDTKVFDFSEYTLLAGDVFNGTDGVINVLDLGYIKTRLNPGAYEENVCGVEGDLNMDRVVNTIDLNLAKDALTQRDDE